MQQFYGAFGEGKRRISLVVGDIRSAELFQFAYAMAYFTLISLVPSLLLVFSLMSLFSPLFGENSEFISQLRNFVINNLATASGPQVLEYLDSVISNVNFKALGFTGFIGTTVTLILLLQKIELALNHIFQVEVKRNLLARFIYFWTILTLGTFLIGLTLGVFSGFGFNDDGLLTLSRHPFAGRVMYFIGLVLFFAFLYKIVPNRFVKANHAFMGALLSAALISLAVQLFSVYTKLFANYEAIYGAALSALPIFLLWLYINWVIILLGAQLTRRLQLGFEKEGDSFFLPDVPMGLLRYSEHVICSCLPFIIMWEIYRDYQTGNFKGFNSNSFARKIGVPDAWIEQALQALCERNYIIMMRSPYDEKSLSYFPTKSADNVGIDSFFTSFRMTYEEKFTELLDTLGISSLGRSLLNPKPGHSHYTFSSLFSRADSEGKQNLSSLKQKSDKDY